MSNELIPFVPRAHCVKEAYEKNEKSLFFSILPPELRLAIYRLVTAYEGDIYPQQCKVEPNKFYHRFDHSDPDADPTHKNERLDYSTLKAVSRQFYRELEYSGVFYQVNNFAFYYINDLHAFLTTISPEKRGHIRSIAIKDSLSEDEIHRDWRAKTRRLDEVVTLLEGCGQLRRLTFDMIDLVAGTCAKRADWMMSPFKTYYARTLLELIKTSAQENSQMDSSARDLKGDSERDSEKDPAIICSELFWRFAQFRLNMHVRYFASPDEGNISKAGPCEMVIDLTDTSDLQWLKAAPEQEGDYFGQPCRPLVEQEFRDLVLETKLAVAKYRSQLFLSQGTYARRRTERFHSEKPIP
ncbi:hypothetical protein GGR53DRAFT_500932 [Hypoxylon sp. FL1150]|nr:hypothetical protein GGR53DRAFT_500932 [Hypoxylon sp. FL1150]